LVDTAIAPGLSAGLAAGFCSAIATVAIVLASTAAKHIEPIVFIHCTPVYVSGSRNLSSGRLMIHAPNQRAHCIHGMNRTCNN
jgi:hypothetical protein